MTKILPLIPAIALAACVDDSAGSSSTTATSCTIADVVVASGASPVGRPCVVCDPVKSTAAYSAKASGALCDDGDAATTVDACDGAGTCVGKNSTGTGGSGGGAGGATQPAGTLVTKTLGGVPFAFSYIPAGTFTMGSPESDAESTPDERPQHAVTLTKAFLLSRTETTQEQALAVMGTNPSAFTGEPRRPVDSVSWSDAVAFCDRLSLLEGVAVGTYGLPTEAQWEFAARAGTTTARYGTTDELAWFASNSSASTQAVAGKAPNGWQLYDMLGNVAEWTADLSGAYDAAAATDPTGPAWAAENRVVRGGSWRLGAFASRAGQRSAEAPAGRATDLGFRPRRSLP